MDNLVSEFKRPNQKTPENKLILTRAKYFYGNNDVRHFFDKIRQSIKCVEFVVIFIAACYFYGFVACNFLSFSFTSFVSHIAC